MSTHEAVDALRELGLSNYEARVFVALQRLGGGTAQDVARTSEVPRSQVYGAADDLAVRGLVEVVESSPKEYRPVSLDRARAQLRERIESQHDRAFENLEAVHGERDAHADESDVATLHGSDTIRDRTADLAADADDEVILVGARAGDLRPDLVAALEERADDGVEVTVVTADPETAKRLADGVRVVVSPASGDDGYVGRTLVVDDATVLLSVPARDDAEPYDEVAMWTANTSIGRILVRYVHAGMQAGLDAED
ncbi:TrmB family transcriptional regulator [Halobacterium litoreum]|uniref:TrmB family transcriptional regulator n=1 Tax=Halobacterium litoreum TaxID=2039234 RepID=A0ABD5N859_9EURY|nr:helix-turn-helix domain-containing protein [Halobacterium litoreum]UHH12125.1 TrmB family transcriptional regulator [Halobacterium litoreum]